MHVAVLGAGVTGVATAYYLAERGHSVTLVDRAAGVAAATSFANGSQLSYSYTDSLAKPEFLPKIPGLLLGVDPAIRVGWLSNTYLAAWGLKFLAQCTHSKARENTLAVLDTAMRSAQLMQSLRARMELNFAFRDAGKLVLLDDAEELEAAAKRAEMKLKRGCETKVVSAAEALQLEPTLAALPGEFAGAIYSPGDQVGDAQAFSAGLVRWLQKTRDVSVRLAETVESIEVSAGRLQRIITDKQSIAADAAVVCLGPWSRKLLKPLKISLPIYPVRGYSVTLPPGERSPSLSVTHLKHRIVYSRLGDKVRIAGFADFLGWKPRHDQRRVADLLEVAKREAPDFADYSVENVHPWAGSRPVTPSSQPIVGHSGIDGLYLNVGHGVLGWTLALATGHDVAAAVTEKAR